jgi:hypothetical protein
MSAGYVTGNWRSARHWASDQDLSDKLTATLRASPPPTANNEPLESTSLQFVSDKNGCLQDLNRRGRLGSCCNQSLKMTFWTVGKVSHKRTFVRQPAFSVMARLCPAQRAVSTIAHPAWTRRRAHRLVTGSDKPVEEWTDAVEALQNFLGPCGYRRAVQFSL